MKKTLAILSLAAASSFAVVKPYMGATIGYTLGQPSGVLGEETSADGSKKNIYGSLAGNAIPLALHAGVMDNDVVGLQVEFGTLIGQEQETDNNLGVSTKSTLSGLQLVPSVVIAAKGPFTPYARFGAIIGLNMKAESKTAGRKAEASGGTAFGFEGALGGEFKLQEKLGVTLEFAAQNLKWAPTDISTSTGGISLVDETNSNSNLNGEYLKEVRDLSNLAIKIGINYHL